MAVVFALARGAMRGRWTGLAALSLLLAVGLGAGIAALVAAWRTEHAYPDHLQRAEVADVVVNPSLRTDQARAIIESTPGIEELRSDVLLTATVDTDAARALTGSDTGLELQIRVSGDGRYVEQDRPVVHEGRMVRDGAEIFLSLEIAADLGIDVGDELPLAFTDAGVTEAGFAAADAAVPPAGRASVEVVGIGIFADGALIDDLYPRATAVMSQDVATPFLCAAPSVPTQAVPFDELFRQFFPPGCSIAYEYFSLRVDGGDDGVAPVLESIASRLEAASAELPEMLVEQDARYYLVPTVTADERERIARSLAPSVTALRLFGAAATLASLGLAVLAAVRLARPVRSEAMAWWQLGATRAQRAMAVAVPLAGAALAGVASAVPVAWLASGVGLVGSARAIEPDPALSLPGPVVLPALAVSVLVLLVGVAAAAIAAVTVTDTVGATRPSQLASTAARSGDVPLTLGVRAALRSGTPVALLGAMTAAVVSVLGSAVFSTNLAGVIETPARYGWSYDAAAITGGGYGDAHLASIGASLDRPEVDRWGVAALGAATVEGVGVPFVAFRTGFDDLPLSVVEGALPVGDEQLAVGALTAERLGLAVGDTVRFSTSYGNHTGTISGLVVLPPIGPVLTDRAGLGTGLVLPAPFLERAVADDAERAGVDAAAYADLIGSFVGIDLASGVDAKAFMDSLGDELVTWDQFGYMPFEYTEPVRPPQIADLDAMRSAPVLLAAVVAAAMAVGLALAIRAAARSRRRELAVLRALGATGGQVRGTLRWQSLTIVGVGLVFGVPLGIALGRITWRAFAHDLGIPPQPTVSLGWTALIAAAALGIGIAAAAFPGRSATRVAPAAVLRSE